MGLRDLFRRSEPPAPVRRFRHDRERMFDLDRTGQLAQLFTIPAERRDEAWQEQFFDAAWTGSVALAQPQPFVGPDGFPYLRLDIPQPGPFESQCLANLAEGCLATGVGAAFFANPEEPLHRPQYVLSYGLIDSLARYDSPSGDPIDVSEAAQPADEGAFDVEKGPWSRTMTVKAAHDVLVGTPSADYLPARTARALCTYLEQVWGLADPRVQLIVDMKMRPHRSLVIGRRRAEFPDEAAVDEMAGRLLWFLPPLRNVMLMPDQWTLDQMTPLRELAGRA